MNQKLVKDGRIILDGTMPLYQKERIAFEKLEKLENAIEILAYKRVDLEVLKCCETYRQFKELCQYWDNLTREEFELLREVLYV